MSFLLQLVANKAINILLPLATIPLIINRYGLPTYGEFVIVLVTQSLLNNFITHGMNEYSRLKYKDELAENDFVGRISLAEVFLNRILLFLSALPILILIFGKSIFIYLTLSLEVLNVFWLYYLTKTLTKLNVFLLAQKIIFLVLLVLVSPAGFDGLIRLYFTSYFIFALMIIIDSGQLLKLKGESYSNFIDLRKSFPFMVSNFLPEIRDKPLYYCLKFFGDSSMVGLFDLFMKCIFLFMTPVEVICNYFYRSKTYFKINFQNYTFIFVVQVLFLFAFLISVNIIVEKTSILVFVCLVIALAFMPLSLYMGKLFYLPNNGIKIINNINYVGIVFLWLAISIVAAHWNVDLSSMVAIYVSGVVFEALSRSYCVKCLSNR
jgi:hypothetical protein